MAHPLQYTAATFGPQIQSASARHHHTLVRTRWNRKRAIVCYSTWYKMSVRPNTNLQDHVTASVLLPGVGLMIFVGPPVTFCLDFEGQLWRVLRPGLHHQKVSRPYVS